MLREYIEQLDKMPQKILAASREIDISKPLIGIICAQNDITAAQGELDELCRRVKEGIIASNANSKISYIPSIDCTAMHGTPSTKYDLPSRDLVANAVELLCSAEMFDGLVFIASEPNVVCGMLIGAIRLNIPCAFLCQGVMSPFFDGKKEFGFVHIYEQIARIKTGRASYEEIENIEHNLPFALGTDCERYGANSFNCIIEAVGLAVRGNGTAPAGSVERKKIAYETGKLAVQLAENKWTPRRVFTQATMNNIVTLDLACGGSSTTMLNLIAISREVGVKNTNFKTIGDAARTTPLLLANDDGKCIMRQFHRAGGVYAMLKQLLDGELINGKTFVYDGVTLQDLLSKVTVADPNIIRSVDNKLAPSSRLRTIYGNVAENGAFVCCGGKNNVFIGHAKVYQNEEMAIDALLHREIKAGDVLVIQNEGPKSGPGMREIYVSLALLKGYELEQKVAVITDGRIADFYNGFAVGHITPETGEQNIFSILQDGDEIEINLTKGKISFDIKAKDLNQRYRQHEVSVGNYGNFFLKNWARTCNTAIEGCTYKAKR